MRYTETNLIASAAGHAASAKFAGYRQRCEANWMVRNGVPLDDIQRRLVLTTRLRQAWGYWYICIYCFFVLGGVLLGYANTLSAVLQRLGRERPACPPVAAIECRPVSLPGWASLLAVSVVLVVLTWWWLGRINGIVSAGTGRSVPSWSAMADDMVALPHDRAVRTTAAGLSVLVTWVPHLFIGFGILSVTLSRIT